MTIFFSAKQNLFFNDEFHGTRLISVADPAWVRPTIKVEDPKWTPPEKEVSNPAWSEGAEGVPETIFVPDFDAKPPLIDSPDESASAPLIEIQNPRCLLPPESELVVTSAEEHAAIYNAIATSNVVLSSDNKGYPITIPAPGPAPEEMAYSERALRDKMLLLTDPLVARHRDELEAERPTTLTVEQYKQLQGYRQDLRDWPESEHFPTVEYRPEQPAWLADHLQ
ncbi:phage tail assembly chaperone [Pseudomonas sp. R81]|uniref:phage tail assembly chaperone n=1 Tax=Pseudomonas sp. R81 TaxID=1144885 RepID=UPI00029A3273|nr:phage tail assembly chaperone [Pseudomonas sp. R81]